MGATEDAVFAALSVLPRLKASFRKGSKPTVWADGRTGPRCVRSAAVLRSLRIENLVLIREAELSFAPGLNAITGETGAGKTILAQAFGLLLGAKGDAAYVGHGA